MLQCNDGTYYVGSTNAIERRLQQHNHSKAGAHYTKIRRPVALVYSEACVSYADARSREAVLKRLTRAQKMALVTAEKVI